jgi:hypothetical protein
MTRLSMFVLLLLVVPFATAQETLSTQVKRQDKSEDRAMVLAIHESAVHEVADGKPLDSVVPTETRTRFSESVASMAKQGYGNGMSASLEEHKGITYRQVIQWSEDRMWELGNHVTVTIVAAPGGCAVKYRPVIGGPELDAGATKIVKSLEPRWYSFSCDCKTPVLTQRVDCTQDTTVSFSCPAQSGTAKPAEKR